MPLFFLASCWVPSPKGLGAQATRDGIEADVVFEVGKQCQMDNWKGIQEEGRRTREHFTHDSVLEALTTNRMSG